MQQPKATEIVTNSLYYYEKLRLRNNYMESTLLPCAAITKYCIPVILIYNKNYGQLFGNYRIHILGSRLSGPILVSLDLHVTFIFIVHSHIMKLFEFFL